MEVRLELDGHTVTDAWCVGTMFRGFEQILVGPRCRRRAGHRPAHLRHLLDLAAVRGGVGARDRVRRADRAQRHPHPQPLPDGRVGDERRAPHVPDVRAGLLQSRLPRPSALPAGPGAVRAAVQGPPRRRDRREHEAHPGDRDRLRRPVAALDLHDARRGHVLPGRVEARRVHGGHRRLHRVVRARRARLHVRGVARARVGRGLRGLAGGTPRQRRRRLHALRPVDRPAGARAGHAAPPERRLLLRPRALAAAVRRAAVPAARRLLRRRARDDRAVLAPRRRRAPALRQVRRSRHGAASVGQRDDPGRHAAARRTATRRRPATRTTWSSSGRWRTWWSPATRSSARCSPPRGHDLAAPVHPAAPAGGDARGDAAAP